MSEPEVEAVKLDESKESEAIASNICPTVLKVEAGEAGGVREPDWATKASINTLNAATTAARGNFLDCLSRKFMALVLGLVRALVREWGPVSARV